MPEYFASHTERHLTPIGDYPTDPPAPTLLDRLDPEEATILYGPGGVGKGTLAVSWAVRLAASGLKVAILDYEDHPHEWSRRVYGLTGKASTGILHLSPNRAYPPEPRAMPGLAGHPDAIRDELDEAEVDYVIIDSAVMAAPGEPGSPESVQAFFAALQRLGRPSLTLAHVSKADDPRYPFGSIFWHNLARITWSLLRDGDAVKLQNRKANNYEWLGAYTVAATYRDGMLGEVAERDYAVTIAERIAEVLGAGPATLDDIEAALNGEDSPAPVKRDSIKKALRRGLTTIPRAWTVEGETWSLLTAA
jgi:AAA domain-containing protein